MRAIGVTRYGGPDALRELDVPPEPIGPGLVRIAVAAAAVNPTDTAIRSGARAEGPAAPGPGAVPGMDAAGVLREVGVDVESPLRPGDHVMAIVVPEGTHGAYREEVVVPIGSVARVPSGMDDLTAATLPMNGLTARLALDTLALPEGSVLAVTGAAGVFGGYVVQLAKAAGLTVVADAAPQDEELVRSLGADHVVRRGPDVAVRIRQQAPGGVDGLADGAVLDDAVLPAVRDGGAVVTVRGFRDAGGRPLRVVPIMVRDYAEKPGELDGLRQLVEQGALTPRVAGTYPAAEAAEAHRRLEQGGVRGRLVLTF